MIYTQAGEGDVTDSMAITGKTIAAVGRSLQYDNDFRHFEKIDLKKHAVIPGLVDAHTHIYFMALSLRNARLDGLTSIEEVLDAIATHSRKLGPEEWVTGEGFSPDRWKKYIVPDRTMLDRVTTGRPAAIFSKDTHLMWANSKALEIAGIDSRTPDPAGGRIERTADGEPTGILKEIPAYMKVLKHMKEPPPAMAQRLFNRVIEDAHKKGVTGVHSFDGPEAFYFFQRLLEVGKLGLRISYYAPSSYLSELRKRKLNYGYGNDYLRLSGVKLFADGALGSQTALCFNRYLGSKDNFGVEVKSIEAMVSLIKGAARLGLPCAIHAIGDKAVANVLDAFEQASSALIPRRSRIEHLQMIRRCDIPRLKKLGLTASMQPSHCPSDIRLIEKYWGKRGRNCYIFKTLLENSISLAFGSDAPIERLDPLTGIENAVNRRAPGIKGVFYPEERINVAQAIFGFTAGPAYAVEQEFECGFLLPGYKADFVVLTDNPYTATRSRLAGIEIEATIFDGHPVYLNPDSKLLI